MGFANSLLPAFAAVIAVRLTSRLTSIMSHDDRVWERKAEAFAAIFEALHDMQTFFDRELMDEVSGREIDQAEQLERSRGYRSARDRLLQTVAREVWLLPDAVKEVTKKLNTDLWKRAETWFDDMESGSLAVAAAVHELSKLAAEDLRRPSLLDLRR